MPPKSLVYTAASPWAPRAPLMPHTRQEGSDFVIVSNGSAGCYGGWELCYPLPQTEWIEAQAQAQLRGLKWGLDHVHAAVVWEGYEPLGVKWEPLMPEAADGEAILFRMLCRRPPQATGLRVRLLMAWAAEGQIRWQKVCVQPAAPPPARRWRLGAAGGPVGSGKRTMKKNVEAYLALARMGAEQNVDLLCMPEVMLSTGLPSNPEAIAKQAISIPGPMIEPFQELAREAKMALCFSAWEKNRELVHNCAVLIGKEGELVGKYRKVHLASPLEIWWGVTPGHEFPVYEVAGARIAMNICMDSSALESARVPARLGAEILCLPIMGDHRAQRYWHGLDSDFDMERWLAIQRTRAMDNQIWLVISRNNGPGTGVFAPDGSVLALASDKRLVYADVDLNELPRTWTWATARNVCWWERREPAYSPLQMTVPRPEKPLDGPRT